MVFQTISFLAALVGSALAGIWDLKTTEIPDKIPYVMIVFALVLCSIQCYAEKSYWPFLHSLATGLSLLALGFCMYYLGQWGGGDAKVLSAVGFFLPNIVKSSYFDSLFPFPFSSMVSYLLNVFLIGTAYMLLYAFVLAMVKKKIMFEFLGRVKATSNVLLFGSVSLFFFFILLNLYLMSYFGLEIDAKVVLMNSLLPLILTVGLFLLWKFTKAVEDIGFRKTIPVSKLKVGDVLEESRVWEGITEKELRKIRRSGKKFVVIKEGVRFAPTFPLALFFTVFFGDVFFLVVRFLI